MSDNVYKWTKVDFYYDKKHYDGRLEFGHQFYLCNFDNVDRFISEMVEKLKLVNCYVFQVAVIQVVETTQKVIEFKKRGEQLEVL